MHGPAIRARMRELDHHSREIAARVAIGLLVQKDPISLCIGDAQEHLRKSPPSALAAAYLVFNEHPDLLSEWLKLIEVPPPE